jgi:hypothetical protein
MSTPLTGFPTVNDTVFDNGSRFERFTKIRSWLDNPYPQRPSPHQILNQMLTDEAALNLRLTNTSRPWNLISTTFETEEGVSVYTVEQPVSAYQSSGKIHFVVRDEEEDSEAPTIPVYFDEAMIGEDPPPADPAYINNRLIIYREGAQHQTIKVKIFPEPDDEVLTYQIFFHAGALDREQALMNYAGPMPELADWLDLRSSMALLPYSRWSDDEALNTVKRGQIKESLLFQITHLDDIVETYLKPSAPNTFEMPFWNE